MRVPELFFYKN